MSEGSENVLCRMQIFQRGHDGKTVVVEIGRMFSDPVFRADDKNPFSQRFRRNRKSDFPNPLFSDPDVDGAGPEHFPESVFDGDIHTSRRPRFAAERESGVQGSAPDEIVVRIRGRKHAVDGRGRELGRLPAFLDLDSINQSIASAAV